jgi:hypothetical protein
MNWLKGKVAQIDNHHPRVHIRDALRIQTMVGSPIISTDELLVNMHDDLGESFQHWQHLIRTQLLAIALNDKGWM